MSSEKSSLPEFITVLIRTADKGAELLEMEDNNLDDFERSVKYYCWMKEHNKKEDTTARNRFSPAKFMEHLSYTVQDGVRFLSLYDTNELLFYNTTTGKYEPKAENIVKQIIHAVDPTLTRNMRLEVIDKIIIENYKFRSILNPENLVGMENGVFNYDTWELEPHSWKNFLTTAIPVEYNPDAYPEMFDNYLNTVTNEENKRILLEALGYSIYPGYHIHSAFLLFGPTHSGKTTFLYLIEEFLGSENCSHISLQQLQKEDKAWYRAKLFGKLANLSPDMPTQTIHNTSIFKSLTGEDKITAEKKGKSPFDFRNRAKMWFTGNQIPPTSGDDSDSYHIRWIIMDFPHTFTEEDKDPEMNEKITTKAELSGIFNVALLSLRNLLDRKQFEYKIDIEAKTLAYDIGSDTVKAFVKYCCIVDRKKWIIKTELYHAYQEFCQGINRDPVANNTFTGKLKQHAAGSDTDRKKVDGKREYIYRGVGLKENSKNKMARVARVSRLTHSLGIQNSTIYKENNSLYSTEVCSTEHRGNPTSPTSPTTAHTFLDDKNNGDGKTYPKVHVIQQPWDLIRSMLNKAEGKPVSIDEIAERGKEYGWKPDNIRKGIEYNLDKGKIFMPIEGKIMRIVD